MVFYKRLMREYMDDLKATESMGIEWYWDMQSSMIDAVVKGPEGTPYEGGYFRFSLEIPPDYPFKPPKFRLLTNLWHPNVFNGETHIFCPCCMKETWSPALTIRKKLLQFHAELLSPNFDDVECCNTEVRSMAVRDINEFNVKAREYTQKYATQENI